MNAEIKSLNRFEEAGFDAGQPAVVAVGVDDLLAKPMAFHFINSACGALRLLPASPAL